MKIKKLLGITGLLMTILIFSSISSFAGNIYVTVYGSGGIIVETDGTQKICPNYGPSVICATLTVPGIAVINNSVSNSPAILTYNGNDHAITIISLTGIQGSGNQRTAQGSNMNFTIH